jgi:hypothetical protein
LKAQRQARGYAPVGPTEEALVQLITDEIWRLCRLRHLEPEFFKQVSCKIEDPMKLLNIIKESVQRGDPGPTLLAAYVRPENGAPMEQIGRQRGLVTRDLFRYIQELRAMQDKRKSLEGKK